MGGLGSDSQNMVLKRDTVDRCQALDIRALKRSGVLDMELFGVGLPCTVSWANGSTIGVQYIAADERLGLHYTTADGVDHQEYIRLDYTKVHFGGRRVWFVCPACGRRAAILYLRPTKGHICRTCADLAYPSSQERRQLSYTPLHRAQLIRRKLGGSANIFEPFPWRPRGMHRKKYWRMFDEYERNVELLSMAVKDWSNRIREEFDR